MKILLTIVLFVGWASAQRSTYAGSGPKGRPGLASRFRDPNESTTVLFVNRVGEDGTTIRIPVDARGDFQLVDRLNQWPRENRPFWLLNAGHIEASRSSPNNLPTPNNNNFVPQDNLKNIDVNSRFGFDVPEETRTIRPTQQRSSFLSNLRP